jgi:hypothetical protein
MGEKQSGWQPVVGRAFPGATPPDELAVRLLQPGDRVEIGLAQAGVYERVSLVITQTSGGLKGRIEAGLERAPAWREGLETELRTDQVLSIAEGVLGDATDDALFDAGSAVRGLGFDDNATALVSQRALDRGQIGFAFRDSADGDRDSGWTLLHGSEPDEYLEENTNFGPVPLTELVDADPSLLAILAAPSDSAWERDGEAWVELEEG